MEPRRTCVSAGAEDGTATAGASEDKLQNSNQTNKDEEYVCLPSNGSTDLEEEGEADEFVCHPSSGGAEVEEMDEEQQFLCEGSLLSSG